MEILPARNVHIVCEFHEIIEVPLGNIQQKFDLRAEERHEATMTIDLS